MSRFRLVIPVIQYGCIAHCIMEYVGDFVVCNGPSMEPTINSDDILITQRLSSCGNEVSKGDIIIARSPTNPHQFICKRVSAVSGERVRSGIWTKVVPKGHIWLQGDNEKNSTDSRHYGAVPQGLVRSRAIFRIWPLSNFGIINSEQIKS